MSAITNSADYDSALRQRGSLPFHLVLQAADEGWRSKHRDGGRGRPEVYSAGWIVAILLVRLSLNQPIRQTLGFVESLLALKRRRVQVPSRTTLSRRMKEMGEMASLHHAALFLRSSMEVAERTGEKVVVLVDSTGLSIRGPGSWRTDKPGANEKERRAFLKLHIAVDAESQAILSVRVTEWKRGDAEVLPDLLSSLPREMKVEALCADGAYDSRGVYAAAEARGIPDVRIPPKPGAREWKETIPGARLRNRHLHVGTRSKSFIPGGKAWAEAIGYHQRSLVETAMSRIKALGASRLRSRGEGTREMEALLALELLNKHAAGGLPQREHRAWEKCA